MPTQIVDVATGEIIARTPEIPAGYSKIHPHSESVEELTNVPVNESRMHSVYVQRVDQA